MKYAYEGESPTSVQLYSDLNELDKTEKLLSKSIAYVRHLNGTLNEAQFCARVAGLADGVMSAIGNVVPREMARHVFNDNQKLVEVILEQEQRRSDYYRGQLIIREYLLPRIKEFCDTILQTARHSIRTQFDKARTQNQQVMDDLAALSHVQEALSSSALRKTLDAARELVAEDRTNGEGRRAFETRVQACSTKQWKNWMATSSMPLELQLLGCLNPNPGLDPALAQRWHALKDDLENIAIPVIIDSAGEFATFAARYPIHAVKDEHEVPASDRVKLMPVFTRGYRMREWASNTMNRISAVLADASEFMRNGISSPSSHLELSMFLGAQHIESALGPVHWSYRRIREALFDETLWKGAVERSTNEFDSFVAAMSQDRPWKERV